MADAKLPDGLTADYANRATREALDTFQAEPSYERLAAFLMSLRDGYLITDVTGTQKKKSTRARTIRSTQGQLLLPLFTSMDELRLAYPPGRRDQAKGAIMPALEALRIIRSSPFVAAQFDAGSAALVVLRKFIELALGDEALDAHALGGSQITE
jgi:hypothetical protein